jgi:hypothetical protein
VLGTVAQAIALAAHGNAYLQKSKSAAAEGFWPSNSTFRYCEFVRFIGDGTAWATDPISWFERLRHEEFHALRLDYRVVGNRDWCWLLEAAGPHGCDWWEPRWEPVDSSRADRRIWHVSYRRIARDVGMQDPPVVDLESLKDDLHATLAQIRDYSAGHALPDFATIFEKSRSQLSGEAPLEGVYHPDLLPAGQVSATAQRLLAASQTGWVFGGMGSWNDGAYNPNDADCRRLTQELHALLIQTYISVANAQVT